MSTAERPNKRQATDAPESTNNNGDAAGGAGGDVTIEDQRAKCSFLFREDVAPGLRLEMDLKKIFTSTESEFQEVQVVETFFGKVCYLYHYFYEV